MLPAVLLAETRNALVIGDKRTSELDRRRDEEPVRRVAAFEMMQLIAAAGGPMAERRGLNAWTAEKALDPRLDGNIEIDPAGVDEQHNLPGGDGAEENRAAAAPAAVDEGARRVPQAVLPAVEPEGDMGVEEKAFRQRLTSRPVSASGSTSSAGAMRSTPG